MDCETTCTPKLDSNNTCGCSSSATSAKTRISKFAATFVALCIACCALPAGLIALGLVGLTTAAYLTTGLELTLVLMAMLGLVAILRHYKKSK